MRPRLIVLAAAAVLVIVGGVVLATRGQDDTSPATGSVPAAKSVTAGEVTVRLEPHHVDGTGAEFRVTLDTHSEELDMDLVAGAELVVGGKPWQATSWNGDGPGGHHREGRLGFDAGGLASGAVALSLDGFPEPVIAQWRLER